MDQARFDALAKTLSGAATTRRAALAALMIALAGGRAAAARGTGRKRRNHPKFLVCHDGQTLLLPARAAKRHLKQGDTAGPCGSLEGGGTCVPLLQTCVPLIGNPCCDANAACVVSDAGSQAGFPDFACRDTTTSRCTTDAECQTRFPNAGPDIVCGDNEGGSFCPKGIPGTGRCCRRRDCSRTNPCQGGVCCGTGFLTGHEVCCTGGQTCSPFGCFA